MNSEQEIPRPPVAEPTRSCRRGFAGALRASIGPVIFSIVGAGAGLGLAACGGGGSNTAPGGPPAGSPGGVYVADANDTTQAKVALISDSGAGWLIDAATGRGFAFQLDPTSASTLGSGDVRFTGTITAYESGSGAAISSGTVTATISTRVTAGLTFVLANGNTGSFNLAYDLLYEHESSLAIIAGSYSGTFTGGYQLSLAIDSAGGLTGSDTLGCSYTGTVTVAAPDFNDYQISNATQTCADGSSQTGLSGPALLIPAAGASAAKLTLAVANASYQLAISLARSAAP